MPVSNKELRTTNHNFQAVVNCTGGGAFGKAKAVKSLRGRIPVVEISYESNGYKLYAVSTFTGKQISEVVCNFPEGPMNERMFLKIFYSQLDNLIKNKIPVIRYVSNNNQEEAKILISMGFFPDANDHFVFDLDLKSKSWETIREIWRRNYLK